MQEPKTPKQLAQEFIEKRYIRVDTTHLYTLNKIKEELNNLGIKDEEYYIYNVPGSLKVSVFRFKDD